MQEVPVLLKLFEDRRYFLTALRREIQLIMLQDAVESTPEQVDDILCHFHLRPVVLCGLLDLGHWMSG